MTLELTSDEALALAETLDHHLREMSGEIAATDSPAFRRGLRDRRDTLRAVRDRLVPAPA